MSFEHIVIAGAGHAGGCAAHALRGAGFAGRITLIGSESHPPYERPPLSKELLAGAVPVEKTYLRPRDWYESSNVALHLGIGVTAIDRAAQRLDLSDGSALPYDALLLTTGARARTLPSIGRSDPRVFYVRDIADSLALRARLQPGIRLAVIGAGFIGLEVAATARKAGCAVTVIEVADQPLARVAPPEVGAYVAGLHRGNGVDLRLNCAVSGVDMAGACCLLRTAGGDTVEADIVVVGIGAVPNQELAMAAGLAIDDGVVVDEFGQTSDAHIFAAGDVTRHFNPILKRAIRLEAWQNAQNQAISVAKVMAGGSDPFAEVPWLWTDQYDLNMQVAGVPLTWDRTVYRGEPSGRSFMMFQLHDGKVVGCITMNAGRDMRFARMLIASGRTVDAGVLADTGSKLQELCRSMRV
jgi:3-phenylpropionate/trans-cinnamate dioxygenase ferredoxin reductase component